MNTVILTNNLIPVGFILIGPTDRGFFSFLIHFFSACGFKFHDRKEVISIAVLKKKEKSN